MIVELYSFTPGSYVVADEWNANFSVLYNFAVLHRKSIYDAYDLVAFPNDDLSNILTNVDNYINSYQFVGTSIAIMSPNVEYWQSSLETITTAQQLVIRVGKISGEARVFFQTSDTRDPGLPPYVINYDGGAGNIDFIDDSRIWQDPGIKCLLFYELNDKLNVRIIKAG